MSEGSLLAPTRHQVDWQNPEFYDEKLLDAEMRRIFDICHGCRRCFNLCDSFPKLFDLIDASPTGELDEVKSEDFKPVVDACTLCDMCYMTKCPYVPPHEFNLDFPHLMLRARAIEAKKGEIAFSDVQLTQTDRNGELAKFIAPLANWATSTENKITRAVLDMVAGVHPKAELPRYTGKTMVARAKSEVLAINPEAPAYGKRKAVLYATCSMNYNAPEVGILARQVLAKNGVETEVVYPGCCGMPQLEQGNIASVVESARTVALALQEWIAKGYDVIAMVPSCALMLKNEWPLLVPKTDAAYEAVTKLAQSTYDLSEFVVDLAKKQGLASGMKPLAGRVALHIACHARAQNIGAKALEMLKLLPESDKITVLERCSGHGGSWGIKTENFPVALKVGKPVAKQAAAVLQSAAENNEKAFVASECPLAGVHIMQGVAALDANNPDHVQSTNPIEIFALAYGLTKETKE